MDKKTEEKRRRRGRRAADGSNVKRPAAVLDTFQDRQAEVRERRAASSRVRGSVAEKLNHVVDRSGQIVHDLFDSLLLWLWGKGQKLRRYAAMTSRRIRRASHEAKKKRFPESDSWPVKVFLLFFGLLPIVGMFLEKILWHLRQALANVFGSLRWFGEKNNIHPVRCAQPSSQHRQPQSDRQTIL